MKELKNHTVKELREKCKKKGIKGYSNKNKADLVKLLKVKKKKPLKKKPKRKIQKGGWDYVEQMKGSKEDYLNWDDVPREKAEEHLEMLKEKYGEEEKWLLRKFMGR